MGTPPLVELIPGTLDMLILKAVSRGPLHGYAIAQFIQAASEDVLRVEEGALYPALHRMEDRGWLEAEWGHTDAGRRAKFYRLTTVGRRQLTAELARWNQYAEAAALILEARGGST